MSGGGPSACSISASSGSILSDVTSVKRTTRMYTAFSFARAGEPSLHPPVSLLARQLRPDVRLEDLADARAGELLPQLHLLGRLHGTDARLHERDQLVGLDLGARLDHRGDALAPLVVRQPDDGAVAHRRVLHQRLLDLGREDVETARDDHVLEAIDDVQVAVLV